MSDNDSFFANKSVLSHKVAFCSAACLSHTKLVLHTQGCAYPIWLASRPWNAEVHIFPIQQGKTAFQSQSARNVALFLFLTELPGTYYGAVRDVYLAMATRASQPPCATAHVTSDKQKNNWLPLLSPFKENGIGIMSVAQSSKYYESE